jgi:hypothetical protein
MGEYAPWGLQIGLQKQAAAQDVQLAAHQQMQEGNEPHPRKAACKS